MNKLEAVARCADNFYEPADKTGTYSIKSTLHGNVLIVKYLTIVHFASESSLKPQIDVAREHAQQLIKEFIKNLKSDFNRLTGESLNIKSVSDDDDLELIHATSNSPRKIAYFRFNCTFEIM